MIRVPFLTVNFPHSAPYSMISSPKNPRELHVPFEHRRERLDFFLANSSDFEAIVGEKLSRSQIIRGIKEGGVLVKTSEVKPSFALSAHEILTVLPEKFETKKETLLPEPGLPLTVIEENEHFIVIDKPAGIQIHPSTARESGTVANWAIARYPEMKKVGDPARPGIVHRLDRDTSGLLLLARTKKSFTALKNLFKNHLIQKRYLALVSGVPREREGIITTPIARSTRGDRQGVVLPGRRTKGTIRPAETHYRVVETFKNATLIEAEPKTGRTHQIRVHLSSIGHPVLGDTLYASKASRTSLPIAPRQLLHAVSLSFALFGKQYSFESSLPKDFEKCLALYKHENTE